MLRPVYTGLYTTRKRTRQHATLLANNDASCLYKVISYVQRDATTRKISATNVASCLHGLQATCKRTQQHATLLASNVASCLHGVISYMETDATTRNIISQRCCVLFVQGYKLRANGCNNTQQSQPTTLRPVCTGLYATSKRTQQHATLLANNNASSLYGVISFVQKDATTRNIISQQCCVLFARGYKLRGNGCNNTEHYQPTMLGPVFTEL